MTTSLIQSSLMATARLISATRRSHDPRPNSQKEKMAKKKMIKSRSTEEDKMENEKIKKESQDVRVKLLKKIYEQGLYAAEKSDNVLQSLTLKEANESTPEESDPALQTSRLQEPNESTPDESDPALQTSTLQEANESAATKSDPALQKSPRMCTCDAKYYKLKAMTCKFHMWALLREANKPDSDLTIQQKRYVKKSYENYETKRKILLHLQLKHKEQSMYRPPGLSRFGREAALHSVKDQEDDLCAKFRSLEMTMDNAWFYKF